MSPRQVEHLVKMANQIALNMAASGDEAEVARSTGEHILKFWTPAMCRQLVDYLRGGGEQLAPAVCRAVESMDTTEEAG